MPQIATSLPYTSILQDVTDAQRPNVLSGVVVPAESAFGWCTGTVEERILSVLTAFHCNPQGKDAQLNSNSTISRPDQPVRGYPAAALLTKCVFRSDSPGCCWVSASSISCEHWTQSPSPPGKAQKYSPVRKEPEKTPWASVSFSVVSLFCWEVNN